MSTIVITGGAGFVGHHFVEHILKNTDWRIVVFDKLTYASNGFDRLRDIEAFDDARVRIFAVDLKQPISEGVAREVGKVDYIVHLAAESHVDHSITDPVPFILNNVAATLTMLEYARAHPELKAFVNFSTDEVYGPAPDGYAFTERDRHHPSNPYSASKSAQEQCGIAYANTYGVPVITTHTMNVIGERQHPEKYVPMVIRKVLEGDVVPIHANADGSRIGSRFYIHARNVADAILHILTLGYHGYEEWNVAGLQEVDNLALAQMIADIIGNPLCYELIDFHSSRPGHDLRYALDSSKLVASGYQYPKSLADSLRKTVEWEMERRSCPG